MGLLFCLEQLPDSLCTSLTPFSPQLSWPVFFSISSDRGHIPAIVIRIMTGNNYSETSYIKLWYLWPYWFHHDQAPVWPHARQNPSQPPSYSGIRALYHHTNNTTYVYNIGIPSEEPPSWYSTSSTSYTPIVDTSSLKPPLPYDLPLDYPIPAPPSAPSDFCYSRYPSCFLYPIPYYLPMEDSFSDLPSAQSDFLPIW